MDSFLKKFFPKVYRRMKEDAEVSNYCKFESQLLTSFTSSLYVAGLIASFVASVITDSFGRKPTIIVAGIAFLAGSGLGGWSYNLYMLILGRVLLGVGVGFANQVTMCSLIMLYLIPLLFDKSVCLVSKILHQSSMKIPQMICFCYKNNTN